MLDSIEQITRISLDPSDLYSNGSQIVFTSGEGKLLRNKVDYIGKEGDSYYTVKYEDTITSIAYKHYKSKVDRPSRYWHIIADANNIQNPLDLSSLISKKILIPDVISFILTQQE